MALEGHIAQLVIVSHNSTGYISKMALEGLT